MTLPQGEIIDAEDLRGTACGARRAADHPSERVATDGQAEGPAQPRPGHHQAGQSFGQDAAGALPVVAESLADAKPPDDRVATSGEIGERSDVMTMDIEGGDMASRAAGCCWCRRDQQGDLGVHLVKVPGVQVERCGVGQSISKRDSNLHVSECMLFCGQLDTALPRTGATGLT